MTHMPTVILSKTSAALAGLGRRVEVPSRLGSVVLLKPLGEGGMSVVHLGRHEILQKTVAVKFLLDVPGSPDDPRCVAFIEGARAAAAIRHPGLNVVHHADAIEGIPYIVMELIDGPTLADLVRKHGAAPPGIARTMIEAASDALGELHTNSIIHRDVKPANIMVDPAGRIVVTDFGLAMERPAALFGGHAGATSGTPTYMAPEMFDATASTRTDVYALGVTMFELLTGEPPFKGDFQELRFAHRSSPVPVDRLAACGVPEDVIVVIERAMHKDALYRPKSARHVLDAFAKACESAGITRATESQIQRFVEVGKGSVAPGPGGARETPTPAYYERLGTLAGQKRRIPEGGSATPAAIDTPPPAATEPQAGPRIEQGPDARAPRAVEPVRAPGPVTTLVPAVAIALGSVLGALACALLYHPAAWVRTELVLLADRLGWIDRSFATELISGSRTLMGRLPTLVGIAIEVVRLGVFVALPMLVLWAMYVRLVLARPRLDGVTRCAWCGHALKGVRDMRCPECGRLAGAVPARTEVPPARRATTRARNLAVAAGVLAGVLAVSASTYYRALGSLFGAPPSQWSVQGLAGMMVLLLPGIAASLVALHFLARRTAPLTGRCRCGGCGASLQGATSPVCPACSTTL